MKIVLKSILIIVIIVLTTSFYSKVPAAGFESNHVSFNVGEIVNLPGHSYQLYLFPLTLYETDHFTSAEIAFSKNDGTFSLTLFREDDHDSVTYHDCLYEELGFWCTLFKGNGENDGSGFTITGVTVANQWLMGIFQFRLTTFPPVECVYLFWGIVINGT